MRFEEAMYFCCEDSEAVEVAAKDPEEAICDYLDLREYVTEEDVRREAPLEVLGFSPKKVQEKDIQGWANIFLEDIVDSFNDEYSHGEFLVSITRERKERVEAFVRSLVAEFPISSLVEVASKTYSEEELLALWEEVRK